LWGIWGLRDREEWIYPEFVLFIFGPVGLYMAAAILAGVGSRLHVMFTLTNTGSS